MISGFDESAYVVRQGFVGISVAPGDWNGMIGLQVAEGLEDLEARLVVAVGIDPRAW